MDPFSIILIVFFGLAAIASGLKSTLKKAAQDLDNLPDDAADQAQSEVEYTDEAESLETLEDCYFDETSAETVSEPLRTTVPAKEPVAQPSAIVDSESGEPSGKAFDLRQAVIYQTILQNDYSRIQ